jgi:hypothetical protein
MILGANGKRRAPAPADWLFWRDPFSNHFPTNLKAQLTAIDLLTHRG